MRGRRRRSAGADAVSSVPTAAGNGAEESSQAEPGAPTSSIRRVALTALAGTSIEFYDFFLYGTAAALVFPRVFFPDTIPPLVGLLASFSTFALGFFARPLGAVIFGNLGDRVGRKTALVAALLLMGVSTTLIGCLPSFATAGSIAPVLLVLLRLVQGLALGGQWGGAVLLVTESAPRHQRGLYGSFAQMGAPLGSILANLAFLIVTASVSAEALLSWGWRVPFLLSVVLIFIGIYTQTKLQDTPAFRQLKEAHERRQAALGGLTDQVAAAPERHSPVVEALRRHPKEIALAAGTFIAMQCSFYILVTFCVAYGTKASGLNLPSSTMLTAVLLGAVAMIPGIYTASVISDSHGRRGILMVSAALLALWSFAIFPLINTRSLLWISTALVVGQFLNGMIFGPLAALFSEMFGTRVRYSGASLGYQLGTLLGGALAPLIATALLARFGSWLPIAIYMASMCGITLVSVWLLRETHRVDLLEAT